MDFLCRIGLFKDGRSTYSTCSSSIHWCRRSFKKSFKQRFYANIAYYFIYTNCTWTAHWSEISWCLYLYRFRGWLSSLEPSHLQKTWQQVVLKLVCVCKLVKLYLYSTFHTSCSSILNIKFVWYVFPVKVFMLQKTKGVIKRQCMLIQQFIILLLYQIKSI